MPFGRAYRGGVSLATGWLAGSLGGAKRIIVSQLADKGSVKIFRAAPHWMGAHRSICRARCSTVMAPISARWPVSSHSMDLPEHGSPQPAPRRAPTCWSAVLRQDAPTQASSNTSSSDRLSRGRSKPCFWDQSGQEKDRSLPSWAVTSGVDLTFATHLAASPRSKCQIQNSTSTLYLLVVLSL